jgi:hypothetical protein
MDAIITVWVITWRTVWPAMTATIVIPLLALLLRHRIALPPVRALAIPLVGPVLIVVWSGLFWAAEAGAADRVRWASDILAALVLLSLALCAAIAVRYRRAPRYWTVILGVAANCVFVLAAGFVGSMAISDTWL